MSYGTGTYGVEPYAGSAASGPPTQAAAVALVATSTLTAGATRDAAAAAALTATSTLTVGATREQPAAATLTAVSTLTATGITGHIVAVGRASETDTARPLVRNVALLIGRASETDTARTLSGAHAFAVGRATEADTARSLSVGYAKSIGRASETDTARALDAPGGYIPTPGDLVIVAMDKLLRQAPTSLAVSVSGADVGEALTFKIDGTTVYTATAGAGGNLQQVSIAVPTGNAGSHTVRVETSSRFGEDTFTIQLDPAPNASNQGADTSPVAIPAALVGTTRSWVFQDLMPGGLGSWVMPINPTAMTSPGIVKALSVEHSTAVQTGQYHIYQGGISPATWSFSGYCPDQDFYDHFRAYAALTRRFYIIDHRNRAWKVAITGLDMIARKRQLDETGAPQDWRHNYTVNAVIYQQQSPQVPV
jgi:hypothetical protein